MSGSREAGSSASGTEQLAVITLPVLACPSCGGSSSTELLVGSHPLRKCDGCDLVHASEYADPDSVYVDGYLTGATDFGPPNTLDPEFQRFLVHCGHRRMEVAERALPGRGRLLDVGCGTGDALVAANERGWEAVGVEPVTESAEACVSRGLDVHCAMLQDSGLPERSFDVVTAFHVLEHMSDAKGFLELISRWARPGGIVMVEVPNFASVDRRRRGEAWIGLRPLEHIGHYTPATLEGTLSRAGLEEPKVRSLGFLWSEETLRQAFTDLALGRPRRWHRPLAVERERDGQPTLFPRPTTFRALRAVQSAYDVARAGPVIVGIGRVPA